MERQTIDHATLARLVEAGAVRGATLVETAKGWNLLIKYGVAQRLLASKHGVPRLWHKLDSASEYLRELGLVRFEVDAGDHDRWFREQVEAAVKEADGPDAVWYEHESVMGEARAVIGRAKEVKNRRDAA